MAPLTTKPPEMLQEVFEGIAVAQRLREELGLSEVAPVDCVVEVAEQRLALEVVLAPLGGSVSGFYLPVRDAPIVVIEQTHPVQRQRFTIAHEVGHHALGHDAAPRIHGETAGAPSATDDGNDDGDPANGTPRAGAEPATSSDTAPTTSVTAPRSAPATHHAGHYTPRRAPNAEERGANAFAGELLIPHEGAKRLVPRWTGEPPLDIAVRLSSHFGVSAFSALVKLQVLGALDRDAAQALRRQLRSGAHYDRYAALELPPLDDELQRHADAGGGPRCSPGARQAVAALRAEFDALA